MGGGEALTAAPADLRLKIGFSEGIAAGSVNMGQAD